MRKSIFCLLALVFFVLGCACNKPMDKSKIKQNADKAFEGKEMR